MSNVTWGVVACVFIHLIPGAVLLFPDDHLSVVGAWRQEVAIHGVSPGHLPHWTLMTAKNDTNHSSMLTRATACEVVFRIFVDYNKHSDQKVGKNRYVILFGWLKDNLIRYQLDLDQDNVLPKGFLIHSSFRDVYSEMHPFKLRKGFKLLTWYPSLNPQALKLKTKQN